MKRLVFYSAAALFALTTQTQISARTGDANKVSAKKSAVNAEIIDLAESGESFDDIVKNNDFVIAKFSTDWCSFCPAVTEVFEEVAADGDLEKVTFVAIDGDKFKKLVDKYKVGYPTILYFKGNPDKYTDKGSRSASKTAAGLKSEIKRNFGIK